MQIDLPKHIEEIVSKQLNSVEKSEIEKYIVFLLEDIFDVKKPDFAITDEKDDEKVVAQRLQDLGYID